MVKILNLEALKVISEESSIENINKAFKNILVDLGESLLLDAINSQVKFIFNINENFNKQQEKNVLDIGVKRTSENDILIIEVSSNYKRFLPIILLREAYYCFIPNSLRENETLKIIINQIIETDLKKIDIIDEWKSLVGKQIVNYDYLSAQFDRIDKFLRLQGTKRQERPMVLFFEYIRRNVQIIDDDNKDEFYDDIFKEFVFKSSKSLRNDEIVETIRILIKIFYKVKSYRALLDYQNYFQEFKEKGEIQTNLSLRKFTSNMKWINQYSYIAPSYQVNWKALNVAVLPCQIRFHPLIAKEKIDKIIEKLPFFVFSKSSENNFSIEVAGWFVAPRVFLKDIQHFIEKLEQNGYIIRKILMSYEIAENFLNLNYYRDFYKNKRIINPKHKKYDDGYEIHFKLDCGEKYIKERFSILDFLLLERIRYWSITGFSFERRTETLNTLKSDLINEMLSQRMMINKLRGNLKIIYDNDDLQEICLRLLENNKNGGFFYIFEFITNIILSLNSIKNILEENSSIKTEYNLKEYIRSYGILKLFNDNLIISDKKLRKFIFQELIPLIFHNRKKFDDFIDKYQIISNFIKSCSDLKIFNLDTIIKIINDKNLVENIYDIKERKLKKSYESYKIKEITSNFIDDLLDDYIYRRPPLIKPILISTFSTNSYAPYYLNLIMKRSDDVKRRLDDIKEYFPRITLNNGIDFFTNEDLIQVEIYLPNIIGREKYLLISILSTLFEKNLISIKRYFNDGFFKAYSRKDFYDFENSEFFYSKDLFIQFSKYCDYIFGKKLPLFQESIKNDAEQMFYKEKSLDKLVKKVENRISREQNDFDRNKLNNLSDFYINLEDSLINPEKFKHFKQDAFFSIFIDSINFKPALNRFNLGSYYLYIRPMDLKEADMKLLLANSFQKIKYPAFVNHAPSFLIKYIFPQNNPNRAHLNYIVKSKKVISEYCLFKIERLYQILHFDRNLNSNGWILNAKSFTTFTQEILFNPEVKRVNIGMKEFDLGSNNISNLYEPDSQEFEDLTKIYNFKSLDLKSIIGTKKQSQINAIQNLLKKKLIFPLLKLKNLSLQEKIYIILPAIKKESIDSILKILNYFPIGICYEITGELYFYGLEGNNEKIFENGLFIKLYLPPTEINSFQKAFDLIFNQLGIKKRIILSDLVDGSHFIESLFGNLDFLESYNPLFNLKWNDIDKRWINVKLYSEHFTKKYPKII